MAAPVDIRFDDKNVRPTDELIFACIGEKKLYWNEIMGHAAVVAPGSGGIWNFYNDGKRWLFKYVHKKKTLFWIAVLSDTFRVTLYFGDKAEPVILASDLSDKIKEEFMTGPRYGKIRAISKTITGSEDVDQIKKAIIIKSKLK